MNRLISFLAPALFFVCSFALISNSYCQTKEPVISMQKTTCRGFCPVYTISIFHNGKVTYHGERNVDKTGDYKKKISKKKVKKLIAQFEKYNFWNFQDQYVSRATDLPTTFISFTHKGKSKKIEDYWDAPKELKELEKMVEEVANSKNRWKKL